MTPKIKVLVTGASSGIGRALAVALLRRGDRVWGVARRGDLLATVPAEAGGDAERRYRSSVCDVADIGAVAAVAREMIGEGFLPDIAILNAGVNPEIPADPFSIATFDRVLRTNTVGALAWVDALLPAMLERGGGRFAAISSLAALRGDARWPAYCASKAALSRALEALRGKYTARGIGFTTVHLGAVETGMGTKARSPFRLDAAKAAARILAAIDRGASSVTIPRYLRLILEATRILPDPLFSRLVMGAFGTPRA